MPFWDEKQILFMSGVTPLYYRETYRLTLEKTMSKYCLNRDIFTSSFTHHEKKMKKKQVFVKKRRQPWSFCSIKCFLLRVIFNNVCEQTGANYILSRSLFAFHFFSQTLVPCYVEYYFLTLTVMFHNFLNKLHDIINDGNLLYLAIVWISLFEFWFSSSYFCGVKLMSALLLSCLNQIGST